VDEAGKPYTVTGDRAQTGDHVLRNLLENAVNYTPKGSVAVSLKKENGKILLTIADSGVGISEEDKKKLFTEGGKGKDSIKVNVHSTGYGLFIAKNVVTAEGGTIRAESAGPGKGSRFIAEFPV
jgi:two-component system CheB/CheR fusion protein